MYSAIKTNKQKNQEKTQNLIFILKTIQAILFFSFSKSTPLISNDLIQLIRDKD